MPCLTLADRARGRNLLVASRTATWVYLERREYALPTTHAQQHDRGFVVKVKNDAG